MNRIDHTSESVLITGASSGIGEEFARELGARGSSLVLVARRADRLDALAAEIRAEHHVRVETISFDLTTDAPGDELLRQTRERGIVVTSVINNAGAGLWATFAQSDPARLRRTVAVNATTVMDISRAFLPQMLARGRGYLLNVTSLAAYSSIPMQGVYSATKAFVLSFTEALWARTAKPTAQLGFGSPQPCHLGSAALPDPAPRGSRDRSQHDAKRLTAIIDPRVTSRRRPGRAE